MMERDNLRFSRGPGTDYRTIGASGAVISPEETDQDRSLDFGSGFIVIVYDNEKNTVDEVIMILQKATGCTLEEAEMETWEVHNLGKSVVHHAGRDECDRVASVIRTIGIRVDVVEE